MADGRRIEAELHALCASTFLADFTFPSPKYKKANGQEKEAADVLVRFGDTLIGIQVKSKESSFNEGGLNPNEEGRVQRRIEASLLQFRALTELVDIKPAPRFKTFRGHELELDMGRIEELKLIVVFASVSRTQPHEEVRTRFDRSCWDFDVPAYLFPIDVFRTLLTMADTIADFLAFLDILYLAERDRLLPDYTDPLDLWAQLNFAPKSVLSALDTNSPIDVVGAHARFLPQMPEFERAERFSYCVDYVIEHLAAGAAEIPVEPSLAKKLLPGFSPNSIESQIKLIPYLARLNRKERTQLGEALLEKSTEAAVASIAYRALRFPGHPEAYFVLFSRMERLDRQLALANMAMAIGVKLKVQRVVAIGGSSAWPFNPSMEALVIDIDRETMPEHIVEGSKEWFSEGRL